jgi:predicted regulator of Ras-like GTPase activity (Roadblock/LC7/MglB family)
MAANIALPIDLAEQIERILADLYQKLENACILLADVSGQLVATQGTMRSVAPATVAALAAGDMAAMTELARQIGEENPHGSFLHEGEDKNIYLFNVAGSFILIVIFRNNIPIGMVRLLVRRTAECLHPFVAEFDELMSHVSQGPDDDFGASLAQELDDMFAGL